MKTKSFLLFGAVVLGLLLTSPAAAQVQWNYNAVSYDLGKQPALAVHPSGLVLEFHRTQRVYTNTLWYHVGRVDGTNVNWGESHQAPSGGSWPNVSITEDGHVLFVWSTGDSKSSSSLQYTVGKIDPNGDIQQTIHWLTNSRKFDAGFHSSTAMNDNGVIVEVHESGTNGSGMFYRTGHFVDLAGGNYNIHWDSGSNGRHYDDGINPHIAINNLNEVVEVHQVARESYLHYRRGVLLSGGIIDFRSSHRYENAGIEPAVALLDNGQVIEAHTEATGVKSCPGTLSLSDLSQIVWSNRSGITSDSVQHGALATDGTKPGSRIAVGSWGEHGESSSEITYLYSAVGTFTNQ